MAASSSSSSSSYNCPCAACKFLRRKCVPGCLFAPYFPPEEPQKFVNVHKIFGASNVTKLLNELLPHQREDAVNSLAYEAEARVRDPVYGCVGAISFLQRQVHRLQKELDAANADLLRFASNELPPITPSVPPSVSSITRYPVVNNPRQRPPIHNYHHNNDQFSRSRIGHSEGEGLYQPHAAYSNNNPNYFLPWNVDNPSEEEKKEAIYDDDVDNV